MKLIKNNFRLWWQKPQKVTERNTGREVTQLELFYDLVYVAIIIQLTHIVAGHVSLESVFQYLAIFMMILWAWFNGSLYHELHGNNDMKTRLFTFMQMLSLIGMGIFIHNAFGSGYQGFALCYSIFLALLTFLWWRTGVHDTDHKPLSTPYVWVFLASTLAFVSSIFTPANISFIIWFVAILFSFGFSFFSMVFPNKKAKKEQIESAREIGSSFVERLGLLTIIILGEGVISTISGATHIENWYIVSVLQIVGYFGILVGIWWIFFDFISRRLPSKNDTCRLIWIGLHFPMLASIGLVNAGILNALEYSEKLVGADRWILIGPLIVFLLCCVGLLFTVQMPEAMKKIQTTVREMIGVSAVGLLLIGFLPTGKTVTLWLIVACLLVSVFSAILTWLKWKSGESERTNV